MIKRIDDLDATPVALGRSHYSRLILSNLQTYGTDFDFCELYELRQRGKRLAVFSTLNGSLIGDVTDGSHLGGASLREISEFVRFKSPYAAELPGNLYGKTGISGYRRQKRNFYEVLPSETSDGIETDTDLERVYITAFQDGATSYGLWLTDTVRRKNKGLLRVYTYETSVLTVRCFYGEWAYISDVATPFADRGKGRAKKLLGGVANLMSKEGYKSYLCAVEASSGFYEHLGFPLIYNDNIFISKD